MSTSLKKPTDDQVKGKKQLQKYDCNEASQKKLTSRFSGMGEKAVMLSPVIIPGYKIRG